MNKIWKNTTTFNLNHDFAIEHGSMICNKSGAVPIYGCQVGF